MSETGDGLEIKQNSFQKIDTLIDPKLGLETEENLRSVAEESFALIGKYLPEWQPTEQSVIVGEKTSADQGSYIGKWKGKHHIWVSIIDADELKNPQGREKIKNTLIHEFLHQRQAEILGTIVYEGRDIDALLQHPVLVGKTDLELAQIFSTLPSNFSELQSALIEGVAIHGELYILKSIIRDSDPDRRTYLEQLLAQRISDIEEGKYKQFPDSHYKGTKLFTGMLDKYGISGFIDIFKKIDWEACGEIHSCTEILDDPTKIPGLNKLSAKEK